MIVSCLSSRNASSGSTELSACELRKSAVWTTRSRALLVMYAPVSPLLTTLVSFVSATTEYCGREGG